MNWTEEREKYTRERLNDAIAVEIVSLPPYGPRVPFHAQKNYFISIWNNWTRLHSLIWPFKS